MRRQSEPRERRIQRPTCIALSICATLAKKRHCEQGPQFDLRFCGRRIALREGDATGVMSRKNGKCGVYRVPATAPAAQSPRKAATSLHRRRGAEDAHRRPEVGASSDEEGVGQEISVPIVAKRGLCVASAVLGSQLSLARMASVPNYMAVINLILGFQYGRHNLRILRYFQSFPNLTHEALKQPESLHLARRHDRSAGLRMSKNKRSEAIFRIVEDAIKFTARSSSGDCAFHFFPKSSGITAGISGLPSCFIPHKVSQCQVFSTFFCTFPCILSTHVVR